MSTQAPDLRRSLRIIRRYAIPVCITAAAGLIAGIATAAVSPARVTSTAVVMLPQAQLDTPVAADGQPDPFTATQEVIAGSNPVLSGALPDTRPAMSLAGLRHDIRVGSRSPGVISVTATGETAGDAEATATAVARSYIQFVGSASSPVGRQSADLLEPTGSATGTARLMLLLTGAMLGTISGMLTGVIAAMASRRLTLERLPGS